MERVIKEELVHHLEKIKFLPKEQFGFRHGKSTTTQMIIFQEHVVKEASAGKTIDVIYMDMEKAFDLLTFQEIISNLKKAKVSGKLLKLLTILITRRKFLVKVNKSKSQTTDSTSGVGQGFVLSAILFIIVFAQISEHLNLFKEILHFIFADDLKLVFSYYINDFDPAILQNILNELFMFCSEKSITTNPTKSVHVQYGHPNPNAKYFINNAEIERKDVTRDLGIYIKNDLSMSHHIDMIYSSTNCKMYSILKKVITNNPQILVKIFNTYIRPNYEYGSPVFNISQKKKFAESIEFLQKTYTKRIFLRNNPNSSYDQIFILDMLNYNSMFFQVLK
uniref:Reverse transcriptase domain-containing protein n=1 Tax=Panagrolaimus davidi TaxID=227884 RepID=A0A914PJ73_9BILA